MSPNRAPLFSSFLIPWSPDELIYFWQGIALICNRKGEYAIFRPWLTYRESFGDQIEVDVQDIFGDDASQRLPPWNGGQAPLLLRNYVDFWELAHPAQQ